MKVRALAPIVLGLTSAICLAQPAQKLEKSSDPADIPQQLRTAHTPEECRALAGEFRAKQESLAAKAAEEKQLMEDRAKNLTAANKYPRPVDSARYRYEYFASEADSVGQLASHYQQLAANGDSAAR